FCSLCSFCYYCCLLFLIFLLFSALFHACLASSAAAISEDIDYLHCYCALFFFFVRRSSRFVQFEQFCYLQKNDFFLCRARGFSLASRVAISFFYSTFFFPSFSFYSTFFSTFYSISFSAFYSIFFSTFYSIFFSTFYSIFF